MARFVAPAPTCIGNQKTKREALRQVILPTLDHERAHWMDGMLAVAGVDEVGLGPLCGPVVAAAVVLPPFVDADRLPGVRDSKTVHNPRQREFLATLVRDVALRVGIGAASTREIEHLNVRGATRLAMQRALKRCAPLDHVMVDGTPHRGMDQGMHTFIVGGDGTCLSIACASLVAKVTRDRLMGLLAKRYPSYGWEHNAGYATADHLAALRAGGPTPHHRALYRPVLQLALDLELGAFPNGERAEDSGTIAR